MAMDPIARLRTTVIQGKEAPSLIFEQYFRGVPPRILGATGLLTGALALGVVLLGRSSWMLLGTALVLWILSGWGIFFLPRPRQPVIAALGSFLLLSAAVAAGVVLLGLYMMVLGPAWVL